MSVWSSPDPHGICTLNVDVGAKRTLRGKRRKRAFLSPARPLSHLASDQREIVKLWVSGGERRKWNTMLQTCDFAQATVAPVILETLLQTGWVEVEEQRSAAGWEVTWVVFVALEELREQLGMVNRITLRAQAADIDSTFSDARIQSAFQSLRNLPPAAKLKRHELLVALDSWVAEKRFGTQRDFALAARGDTKKISSAEWDWLESVLPIEDLGVSRHTPLLHLRFPGVLCLPNGEFNLGALGGFCGVSEWDICSATEVKGLPGNILWRIVENRTTFEKTASLYSSDMVVWVPGFAPSWWIRSVGHLLRLFPRPLVIGCDPDPAGVAIALQVTSLWEKEGVPWEAVGMDPEAIRTAPATKPLTECDRLEIGRLYDDPRIERFRILLQWMEREEMKAEQEGVL